MKIFKSPTLRTNLIIWLIMMVMISTSFFFFIYYRLSENPLKNIVKDNLITMSKNKANFIDYWLNENLKTVQTLAQSPAILSGNPDEISSNIEICNKVHPVFAEMGYVTVDGITMYSSVNNPSVDISDRDYFIAARNNKEYISDNLISRTTKKPMVVVSYPIIKGNTFNGAIIGVINLDEMSKMISANGSQNINNTYVLNKNGDQIISTTSNGEHNSVISLEPNILKSYISKALDTGSTIIEYSNNNNQKMLGSYTVLPHKDWILVNELDISQNITTIRKSSAEAGIFTLFAITIMLIPFIIYISKKLTKPLINIAHMASELADGNFDMRLDYSSKNEIGLLAKSFDIMAQKLQYTYGELKKRISDLNAQKEEINLKNLKLEQVIEVNKTILEQVEAQNKQIEQESKVKAEFLATMSHEFRTPMNSIIGYTEMILDGNDGEINEEQEKDLHIILKSAENLLKIINDVLDLSKLEAGKMTFRYEKFNLVEELQNIIENIKVMSQSKKIALFFEYEEDWVEIYSDPAKINNIISNILSNAVKFTDSGYVRVSLTKQEDNFVSISVEDTGIGIPEDEIHSIFDEFRQIDGSSTRKYGGTGLGLAISRALVEGLGGNISVISKVDEGSTFTVTLPISKACNVVHDKKDTQEPEEPLISLSEGQSGDIVVITRNSNNFSSIESILSQYDFKVVITDYVKAVDTVKTINPVCIFIDIDLPCTNCNDGWITLTDLKQDKTTASIPKVIVSTQTDYSLSFILGANDYLIKPFNTQDLLKCINRCLEPQSRGYILLVDDNKNTFNLVSKATRKITPYSLLMANSIKDISNVLESYNFPKLVILNATLSSVKSFEVINLINSLGLANKIPIIVLADKNLNSLEQQYLRQHSKKILFKHEIRYSKLISEIKKLLFEFINI